MKSFRVETLGCKVNQYESHYVREALLRAGYTEVERGTPADIYVVNTCTVTAEADAKGRKLIRHLARENPSAQIVVIGCYAARAEEDLRQLPNVTHVLGDKSKLPELLRQLGVEEIPTGIEHYAKPHRAFVKVQDGCRMPCTYCIIPTVRPKLWSRPIDEVEAEVRRLVQHGYKEIVLTGIHLGHYGAERPSWAQGKQIDLTVLLERLLAIDAAFRIRLSSIEAVEVSDRLLRLMAAAKDRFCPHLHLPMQSGSDKVLERMRRRWASAKFAEKCQAVREALDYPAITTDVIVGFPGETEEDFQATCRMVEDIRFAKLHVFRFSARQGTPAAKMTDQVPGEIKRRRAETLIALGNKLRYEFVAGLVGRREQVLVEGVDNTGMAEGMASRYLCVRFPATEPDLIGRLVWVEGTSARKDELVGRLLSAEPAGTRLRSREAAG